jgi:hypothetical protein
VNHCSQALEIGSARRTGKRLSLCGIALLAVAAAGVATAAPASAPSPVQSRSVIVTDDVCGAEGARRADHRRCALERVSEGGRLVLYDPERDALYEITYGSPELRLKVLNDMAGLRIVARGRWDDEKHVVALTGASVARKLPPPEAIESVD